MRILDVKNLIVDFETKFGNARAVDNVSFDVEEKEILGLAGESGCGKTTTVLSLLKLLPPSGKIVDGKILYNGRDITQCEEAEMRKIRWKDISIIFQGAMNSLSPVKKVGDQGK